MDIHESPVVCCQYLADCPGDLIPCLYSVGAKAAGQSRHFSERDWPITGGEWGPGIVSYPELIITGHADGSVRFWDASSLGFQVSGERLHPQGIHNRLGKPRTSSRASLVDD